MESEWKRNGKGKEKNNSNLLESKFVGMEWNWNGNGTELSQQKNLCKKRNGNGMEMEW